ncbi:MAG: hypothetical protein ACW98F_02270 [Candidatus Hodarchaeales archaeon]|jgi:chromosome segregation ATPase
MSDSDLGNFIMKLFDPLISESKTQLGESRDKFLQSVPRRIPAHSSVPVYQAENFIREITDQLIKINQDLLNQYSISIAKKTRSFARKNDQSDSNQVEELHQSVIKKEAEVDGLQKQVRILEQRAKTLEDEKEETLKQFSHLNTSVIELESQLTKIKTQHENQLLSLASEWEEKFRANQEEWDSYVKLKLAEREVQSSVGTRIEEE